MAVAEQTATLDIISGGKFLFGLGQGYRDQEFQSFGVRKRDRRRRMAEVIRRLRSEENVDFEGEFVKLEGVTIAPKPIQQPGPPLFVGADLLETVVRVPEVGDHWIASRRHTKSFLREAVPIYKKALDRHGKEDKGLFLFRDLCVAKAPGKRKSGSRKPTRRCTRCTRGGVNLENDTTWALMT